MSTVETTTYAPDEKRPVCGSIVPQVNGVDAALLVLATVAVILRPISSHLVSASLWWEYVLSESIFLFGPTCRALRHVLPVLNLEMSSVVRQPPSKYAVLTAML